MIHQKKMLNGTDSANLYLVSNPQFLA